MPVDIESLDDLLLMEIKDIYDAENQIVKALPKMAEAASSPELKQAFQTHLQESQAQVDRLEQVFQLMNQPAKGKTCEAMKGLIKEGQEVLKEDMPSDVKDAALIAAAQKVEHYEIASYGTVRTWAELLGLREVAGLLQQSQNEEEATDKKLTMLAKRSVNVKAAQE